MQTTWMALASPAAQWTNVGMPLELLQVPSLPFQDSLDFHIPIFSCSKVILGPEQEQKGTSQLGCVTAGQSAEEP